VSEVRQFLQVDRVFIYRFEPDWWSCGRRICRFRLETYSRKQTQRPQLCPNFSPALQTRSYQATDIYAAGLTQCYVDFLAQFQVRAVLVVPILQGEVVGLLVANHCSEPRQWQQLEIDLLKQLATQLAIAIQQSTLFEQAQTELAERKRAERNYANKLPCSMLQQTRFSRSREQNLILE